MPSKRKIKIIKINFVVHENALTLSMPKYPKNIKNTNNFRSLL